MWLWGQVPRGGARWTLAVGRFCCHVGRPPRRTADSGAQFGPGGPDEQALPPFLLPALPLSVCGAPVSTCSAVSCCIVSSPVGARFVVSLCVVSCWVLSCFVVSCCVVSRVMPRSCPGCAHVLSSTAVSCLVDAVTRAALAPDASPGRRSVSSNSTTIHWTRPAPLGSEPAAWRDPPSTNGRNCFVLGGGLDHRQKGLVWGFLGGLSRPLRARPARTP